MWPTSERINSHPNILNKKIYRNQSKSFFGISTREFRFPLCEQIFEHPELSHRKKIIFPARLFQIAAILQHSCEWFPKSVFTERNLQEMYCLEEMYLLARVSQRLHYLARFLPEKCIWTDIARCLQNMRLCSSRVIESVGNPVYFVVILQFQPLFWQYWISLFKVYLCRVCVCRSKFSSLTNKSPSSTVLIPRNSSILQKSAWEHIILEAIICKS